MECYWLLYYSDKKTLNNEKVNYYRHFAFYGRSM
jgi:hypothetical protein